MSIWKKRKEKRELFLNLSNPTSRSDITEISTLGKESSQDLLEESQEEVTELCGLNKRKNPPSPNKKQKKKKRKGGRTQRLKPQTSTAAQAEGGGQYAAFDAEARVFQGIF